jgi:septum formation protein
VDDSPLRARVLLASASPRRRELLARAGLAFEVGPVEVDEELAHFSAPEQAALELAARKAHAAARARLARDPGVELLVLGADTVVAVELGGRWELLGKPGDAVQAARMLASLSATRHQVVTGVCAVRCPDLAARSGAERTWVTMRRLAPAEIDAYVASGEWRDKAGGYAIQESADRFVTALEEGGFDNVVGLPVGLSLRLLKELSVAPPQGRARGSTGG